ncbi:MAG: glycogen/starch/alpha-glucan phosphorylase [Clostridiales bacterium]|nr:glycogen/starch/alpha-glucan phosphorylase [Clostridiales bacterium]
MSNFSKDIEKYLKYDNDINAAEADTKQLYEAVSKAAVKSLNRKWGNGAGTGSLTPETGKKACYLSAEFLTGRLIYNNLFNLGLLKECNEFLHDNKINPAIFEEIEDNALGNGGLGRLAACFLDSAATHGIRLDGYGIRYKYGIFRQSFENGFQKETKDDWQRFGDPWSVRREEASVLVDFADRTVRAVPYDTPVIGYGGKTINTLRLWQAEPLEPFDFDLFNAQKYDMAVAERIKADNINAVLYPNDDTEKGKRLRLEQQYFFSSASLKSIVAEFTALIGENDCCFDSFPDKYAIQLNDTHPVVAVPELLRLLMSEYYLEFNEAFDIVRKTFAYTNHTIMQEALEKWDAALFTSVIPEVYPYVVMINDSLKRDLAKRGIKGKAQKQYMIIDNGRLHMARLAVYATHSTNGVAQIHTEILKNTVMKEWYELYPERFNNKSNGITQRRWLALCNRELADFITDRTGKGWLYDLDELKKLMTYSGDKQSVDKLTAIKMHNNEHLCKYFQTMEGITLDPSFVFDIQIKRLHEYKRQLLNAFSIMDIYFGIKAGTLGEFRPTAFIFGAKAAPGYARAKGIIKYINEVAKLVNGDPEVNGSMRVVFVRNYNVSYAEKLIPAADISEQISTAGTEASGTGNMKFMLNGAVTLGTMDGANIEIVEEAGENNNFIFGARVEELEAIKASYDPMSLYKSNPRIRRVMDTLIDGTFNDGKTGIFKELYTSILEGAEWHEPDVYRLLYDFESYCDTRLRAINATSNKRKFARMCLANIANAGKFSSDRTIREYDRDIWHTNVCG